MQPPATMDDNGVSPVHSSEALEERADIPPASPVEASQAPPVAPVDDGTAKQVEEVLYSDVSVKEAIRYPTEANEARLECIHSSFVSSRALPLLG